MADWKASDPRVELIDQNQAVLVLLRPHPNGQTRWEAGTGFAEMKHGWQVLTSFENCPSVSEVWPEGWLWILAPELAGSG